MKVHTGYMDKNERQIIDAMLSTRPQLRELEDEIYAGYSVISDSYKGGGKLLVCGNGGSAGDADHIVGELMKGFLKKRPLRPELRDKLSCVQGGELLAKILQEPLQAISLSSHAAFITAFSNDVNYEVAFAQQVLGYGKKGDVLIAISTSGESENIVNAAIVAKAIEMKVISLTGKNSSSLSALSDCCIQVPDNRTWAVQDMHSTVYHTICALVENHFCRE